MKALVAIWFVFFSSSLLASEAVQLHFELEHNVLGQDGWTTRQTVDLPFSVPLVLASDRDTEGFLKEVRVTLAKEQNDMIRVQVEYRKLKDNARILIQDSTIITKLGEPATLETGGEEGADALKITIHPSKLL